MTITKTTYTESMVWKKCVMERNSLSHFPRVPSSLRSVFFALLFSFLRTEKVLRWKEWAETGLAPHWRLKAPFLKQQLLSRKEIFLQYSCSCFLLKCHTAGFKIFGVFSPVLKSHLWKKEKLTWDTPLHIALLLNWYYFKVTYLGNTPHLQQGKSFSHGISFYFLARVSTGK